MTSLQKRTAEMPSAQRTSNNEMYAHFAVDSSIPAVQVWMLDVPNIFGVTKSLSEKLEPFRLRRDRRACRRVIRIGSKTWKSDGLVYGRAGCAPSSPRRRASRLPAATSVARRRAETPCRTRCVVPALATVMRPGVLRAYPKNGNLFACGVIAVRAAGLFG